MPGRSSIWALFWSFYWLPRLLLKAPQSGLSFALVLFRLIEKLVPGTAAAVPAPAPPAGTVAPVVISVFWPTCMNICWPEVAPYWCTVGYLLTLLNNFYVYGYWTVFGAWAIRCCPTIDIFNELFLYSLLFTSDNIKFADVPVCPPLPPPAICKLLFDCCGALFIPSIIILSSSRPTILWTWFIDNGRMADPLLSLAICLSSVSEFTPCDVPPGPLFLSCRFIGLSEFAWPDSA